ncbi:MAG TPA: serine/threonine-protein kinase, partial [Nannocystis sp.]
MPQRIGRFVVLERLGAGGMGVVYAAYDPQLDRKVAVKLLLPSLSGSDREDVARARLLREAQALARLSHPNVVAVYDVGTHAGQVFIAMEFIAGESLTSWLKAEPRSVREVLAVFQDAGRGLAAAHRAGLVHGDFKPDNVLVDRAGRVRVVDFGLAFAQEETRTEEESPGALRSTLELSQLPARPGMLVGTPAYMAPEQFHGEPGSARSDQFSFCVSLYEGLYGHRPFAGDDVATLKRAVCLGAVPDEPRDRRLPPWLRRVLLRGLHWDAAQRFSDMDQLLAALARDPGRRWRRAGLTALAVLTLAGAAWGYRWAILREYEQRQGLCAAAAENLAGIWDHDRKDMVQKSFMATGVAYAADTWARVAARLDAHTAAWVRMHT